MSDGSDFEELVQIALSHGISRAAAVGWATNVQREDQKFLEECIKEIPQRDGKFIPLRHFLHELERRLRDEDSDR